MGTTKLMALYDGKSGPSYTHPES